MDKNLFIIGDNHWNTASRAKGAEEAGWEVVWSVPSWTKNLPLWRRYFQYRFRAGPDIHIYNKVLISQVIHCKPTVVWIEEPYFIFRTTLSSFKEKTGAVLVCAYSDDPRDPAKKSRHFDNSIDLFDLIFTTKDELRQQYLNKGCNYTGKFWKGYDPQRIFPLDLSKEDEKKYRSDVSFIGHADFVNGCSMRKEPLLAIAKITSNMKIWGRTWKKVQWPSIYKETIHPYQLEGTEYSKAISGAKIAIQLPSRLARDTHSSRSVEIPACRTLMVAERTVDHQLLFDEDKEAVFFGSIPELVEKIRFYLDHEESRLRIAKAGYNRCIYSRYSNVERMKQMLSQVEKVLKGAFV